MEKKPTHSKWRCTDHVAFVPMCRDMGIIGSKPYMQKKVKPRSRYVSFYPKFFLQIFFNCPIKLKIATLESVLKP